MIRSMNMMSEDMVEDELLSDTSERLSRIMQEEDSRKPAEKKLSIMSIRDSEMDLLGLVQDPVVNRDGLFLLNDSQMKPTPPESNTFLTNKLMSPKQTNEAYFGTWSGGQKKPNPNPAEQESSTIKCDAGDPALWSSPAPITPRSHQCCGDQSGPVDVSRTTLQQQRLEHSSVNSSRVKVTPKTCSDSDSPTSTGAHTDLALSVRGLDTSTIGKGNHHDQNGGGLFQILLHEGGNEELVNQDGGNHTGSNIQQVSMATSDTSGEDLTPRVSSPNQQPAPKKRRKASKKALCPDPFAKLPKVKLRPFVWMEDSDDEMKICERKRQRRKSSSLTGRSPRSARHFEDPFKELAFIVFDSADVDCDKRLRRAEFGSILKSPTLELELSADDIRRFEKDCSKGRKDIRDLPVSFDEFLPLAKYLLMLYYNKQDAKSRNPWSILDRGRECPPYYFNKHTGEVSADRPLDYDNQPELFLFEKALRDAFETADMDKDGRIHLHDFIRIINSEDFGLILTKKDITEITKHFKNEAGKVDKVCYSEFLPLAKRLVVAIFSARDPVPDDWCYLCTRQVGPFWFNKRTGQSFRHPPNHFVTMQQQQLRHRKHEAQVLLKTSEELKVTKANLEEETTQRKDFEEKYTALSAEHSITSRELKKMTRLYDKCRVESEKKTILLDANEKEKAKLLHTIEQLEARVIEAERTESNLESMRDVLKNCQGALREHELDILSLRGKIEDQNKQLSESESRVEDGKGVIADLHQQLREEIKRNEKMEIELKKVPNMKKEMEEDKESLQLCQKRLEERNAVLTLTRQVNHENKTKIKTLETELLKLPCVEKELELAQCEVYTLKQLIIGKDSLVAQKSQELDSVKERLEYDQQEGGAESGRRSRGRGLRNSNPPNGVNFRVVRLQKRGPAKSAQVGAHSTESKSSNSCSRIDVGTPPYDSSSSSSQSDCKNARVDQRLESSDTGDVVATSLNTANGSFLRLLHKQGNVESDMPTIYDLYTPEGSYTPTSRSTTPILKKGVSRRPKSSMARLETEGGYTLQKGTLMFEDDFLVAQFLQVGDRVRIKKKGGKGGGSILSGIVKFIGKVDKEFHHNDHRLYTGIKLDEAVGDTDGVIKGKRYFTVNPRHGKLVPITDIVSVLNQKTATYNRISEFIRQQRLETGTVQYERSRNAQLIRVM